MCDLLIVVLTSAEKNRLKSWKNVMHDVLLIFTLSDSIKLKWFCLLVCNLFERLLLVGNLLGITQFHVIVVWVFSGAYSITLYSHES